MTDVMVVDVDLTMYDRLLQSGEDHERERDRSQDPTDRQPQGASPAGDAERFEEVARLAQQESQSYERYLLENGGGIVQRGAGEMGDTRYSSYSPDGLLSMDCVPHSMSRIA